MSREQRRFAVASRATEGSELDSLVRHSYWPHAVIVATFVASYRHFSRRIQNESPQP
jgi:hypothetical protein